MKDYLLCVVSVLMLVSGQLLLGRAMQNVEITSIAKLVQSVFSPMVLLALVLYGAAFLLWIFIVSRVPLSFAYPIQAMAFPLVVLFSSLFLNETVPVHRWVGVAVIMIGVLISSLPVGS